MSGNMPPPRLQTARLLLRPFTKSDVEDVYAYARDPEFWRYLPGAPHTYTRVDAATFVDAVLARDETERIEWAIQHSGHVIGAINLRPEPAQGRASMGYGIGREWWGQGLTTEAARAVVGWAFQTMPIRRVFATADARNIGSRRVMEHLGMRHEGTLRAHRMQNGEVDDEVYYGILRNEWEPN
jgi:[ribosomal protein S5]-alanine N-acetyltransferase